MKPLLITQEGLTKHKANLELRLADLVNTRKQSTIDEEGIATIHIYGPLMSDSTPLDRAMGATDYDEIKADIENALKENARAIVLEVNSPGGSCSGLQDLSETIESLPVPVVAHCKGNVCSAAYWLASGCSWIVADKSAYVGNIGVILVLMDTSRMSEEMGIEVICFTNDGADLKSTGHLDDLSDSQAAFLQNSVNTLGENFKAAVGRNRAVSDEVWRGGWFAYPQSLELGLIDSYGDLEAAKQAALNLTQI